jgi:hypothetical protein
MHQLNNSGPISSFVLCCKAFLCACVISLYRNKSLSSLNIVEPGKNHILYKTRCHKLKGHFLEMDKGIGVRAVAYDFHKKSKCI